MVPYYFSAPTPSCEADIEESNCRSCGSTALYHDHSEGDIVCTSCGIVQSQHFKSALPEWRDYSSIDPDAAGRNVTARAGSMVDESRWAGGLEPTALGRVYNPSASTSYGSGNVGLEGYRRKIVRMKRVVDRWVEKEFERHVEEGKVALRLKEKKRKLGATANGDNNSHGAGENQDDGEEEDWTEFSTNEHEALAKQRMGDLEKSNTLFIAEKWSLDRALLLHGDEHEIPSQYTSSNSFNGEQPKDLENERHLLNRRMDKAQRNASADLYCAYKLIQRALAMLNLCENTTFNNEVMSTVCKFADRKGNLKIKGVASRISSDVKNNDQVLYEQLVEYCKQRQISALASAAIFMECKKKNVGRTVKEICSSFEPTSTCANIAKLNLETFIKTKHLFKAIHELKELLPDHVKAVQSVSTSSSTNANSSNNNVKEQTESQVDHFAKKLKLSSTASTAISKLALSCKSNELVGSKKTAFLASVIYLVCDAATTMQRLSKSALEKKMKDDIKVTCKIKQESDSSAKLKIEDNENSFIGGKPKHKRPNKKRKLLESAVVTEEYDMLKPLEVISSCSSSASSNSSPPSVMQSYHVWSSEKSWYRSLKQIEQSCNVTEKIICDFYKKEVYPKRRELLSLLQDCQENSLRNDRENVLLSNIATVAPLMVVAKM